LTSLWFAGLRFLRKRPSAYKNGRIQDLKEKKINLSRLSWFSKEEAELTNFYKDGHQKELKK